MGDLRSDPLMQNMPQGNAMDVDLLAQLVQSPLHAQQFEQFVQLRNAMRLSRIPREPESVGKSFGGFAAALHRKPISKMADEKPWGLVFTDVELRAPRERCSPV